MKKYTVKQVMKLEEQAEKMDDISRKKLDELYFLPLSFLSAIGIILTTGYLKTGSESILPLILGGTYAISGITIQTFLSSAGQIREKLYEKINKIYSVMGNDFEKEVKLEQFKQNNNHLYNQLLASYSDEEIANFYGGRQR